MNNAFVSGFIKAAQVYGFSTEEALHLIKSAGRGAVMKAFMTGAQSLHNQIPGIAKAAPKAYDKMMNTAETLKGMVNAGGIAERGSMAATQQGDMARLLRDRVRVLKPAVPDAVNNPVVNLRNTVSARPVSAEIPSS
jgi:dsDNA-binding SOS-regulon protein